MTRIPDRDPDLKVTVYGDPRPKGSVNAHAVTRGDGSPVLRPDGRPMIVKHDDTGAKGKQWLTQVAQAVALEMLDAGMEIVPPRVPVDLEMVFYRPRAASHYRSGRNADVLKPSAPVFPATRPDVDKLCRSILDALTGVAWHDDGQVTGAPAWKEFGTPARVELRLWRLPATVADLEQPLCEAAGPQNALFATSAL